MPEASAGPPSRLERDILVSFSMDAAGANRNVGRDRRGLAVALSQSWRGPILAIPWFRDQPVGLWLEETNCLYRWLARV